MMDEITERLCRYYTIPCPACENENRFPRLRMDIYRVNTQESDGHPLEYTWHEEGEFPPWVTPLNYFWGICERCFFTALLDSPDFRQWKKNAVKFRAAYHEGALEALSNRAGTTGGVLHTLGRGIQPEDLFGKLLSEFHLGVFSECLRISPAPGALARSYLRIAWVFRDEERLYAPFAGRSEIRELLSEAAPLWSDELIPNDNFPVQPGIVADELGALRFALAFFERNFISLQEAGHEEEMRLMTLIAEIGYRIYELTGTEEDFTKARGLFSGTMQKCLRVINDKSIVGGAVNRARDILEKAGDRGRELRILQKRREKQAGRKSPAKKSASPPSESRQDAPGPSEPAGAPPAPSPADSSAGTEGASSSLQALQQRVAQLDEDNKRWMRLAGLSELTGLPNRVMLSRVLLPGALKQAIAQRQPLGCIAIAPEGLSEINGKFGHATGDTLIKEFSECLKKSLRPKERLCHLEGVNFALLIPAMAPHQLRKRAESLHRELTSRRFDLEGKTFSLKVSIGVAELKDARGTSPKALQEALYSQAIGALDTAKLEGNRIEVHDGQF